MSGSRVSVSAAALLDHIEALTAIGPRPDGSDAEIAAREYVVGHLAGLGLEVIRLPMAFPVVEGATAAVRVDRPYQFDVPCEPHLRSGLGEVRAPVVYAGKLLGRDLASVSVAGSIALAFEDVPFEGDDRDGIRYFGERVEKVARAGAVGLVFADYRSDGLITTWGIGQDLAPIPCVGIPYPDFDRLRHLAVVGDVVATLSVGGRVRDGEGEVLSALVPGDRPDDGVVAIVGTHTDSVHTCSTANDNASGLALLLELARVVSATPGMPPVLLVVTTGEEAGSLGAKAFGEHNAAWLRQRVTSAIAFDQIGGTEAFLSAVGDGALNRRLAEVAIDLGYLLRRDDEVEPPRRTGLADVEPFARLGIPSAYLGGWTQDPVYHTRADLPGAVSMNALKALGDIIAATLLEPTP